MDSKGCQQCGAVLKGRSDKKFCSSECRIEFNNMRYRKENESMIAINKILRTNRSILKTLNPEGKIVISAELLLKSGFDLDYFTNIYTTKTGREYRYCYDYGYHYDADRDSYLLVKKQEWSGAK